MSLQENHASVSLRELVVAHTRSHPESPALLSPQSPPLTYTALSAQISRIGNALRSREVARSDRVALVLPNGPEMAATFLGVASYAACAPLNPAYGPAELEFYLEDLAVKAVMISAETDGAVRKLATRLGLLVLDAECCQNGAATDVAPADCGRDDDVALILHTSGTTSRPKQVPLSHQNLCASAVHVARVLQLSPADCCLNMMPLFHIHGLVGVLLSSMVAGGSVVCTKGFSARTFAELLQNFRPTWYSAVPTIHQAVLAEARNCPNLAAGGRLRLIRSSSSALPPTVMADLENTFGVPVIESYGMTEAAHQMASNPLPPAARKPGSVGLPAGPEMGIMDDDGKLLPDARDGEIVIRGPSVTDGYCRNPEANAAAFTNGWFRTGDLGRRDPDGYYFISGRKKEMINRGGEKISPREIDEVLLEHDAVQQAVAFAVPHPTLGEDVAAAVVLRGGLSASEGELRRFAFERLAPFKVPSRIVFVDSIPKGPTGKIQRIGLHQALADELRMQYIAPRTDLEKTIVAFVEQVLETNPVGATDNFFALGGDSLKAARVLARLSAEYQIELPAISLFLNPTAEELSLEITRLLGEDTGVLDALLAEIEGMSDEEARRQLSRHRVSGAG